jgi:gamma-glutamyltranspeptidase/glutathione hydrolase
MTERAGTLSSLLRAGLGLVVIGGGAMLGGWALQALLGVPGGTQQATSPAATVEGIAPESLIARSASKTVTAQDFMMVAAHPAAAQIGAAILDQGGSAVDAIIATQMALTLVEPQSSGIGGGGFLLVWDAETDTLTSYDGRETAPAQGSNDYVLQQDGNFRPFMEVVTGGASVGVPGIVRMLELAHGDHGTLPWQPLFTPTIDLAEKGFPISPRLHGLLQQAPFLKDMEPAGSYFYDSETGQPYPVGTMLHNPDLAETLRIIATQGADAFYTGPLADKLVTAVQTAVRNPGALSRTDLEAYEAVRRDNLCLTYRVYQVCGMAPPSSGGSTVLQILGLMEQSERDIRETEPLSPEGIQIFGEAMRLAFADRNRFLADTDFVTVPLKEMLAPAYLVRRARTMDFSNATKVPRDAGNPTNDHAFLPGILDDSPELPSTSHLVAVDRNGTVATMTTSIETGFGSRVMVGGFLLNNQLTDFAWSDMENGLPIANRYEPKKRPRSSMAPTLVFDPVGQPRLAIGSPGGSRIIGYVAKTVMGVLDWDMSLQQAIESPHFLNRNGAMELEADTSLDGVAETLAAQGYDIQRRSMASGLHGVEFKDGRLIGGVDPRREGLAVGEGNLTSDLDQVFGGLIPSD